MNQNRDLESILRKCTVIEDDGYISISGSTNELETLFDLLCMHGYQGDKDIESGSEAKLWISRQAGSWASSQCPIFTSLESLWSVFREGFDSPAFFYYSGEAESPGLSLKLEIYFRWKRTLRTLADHEGAKGRLHSFIFFIDTDKGSKKFEVNPLISTEEFLKIEGSPENAGAIKAQEALLLIEEDIHSDERRRIMRAALAELSDSTDVNKVFVSLANKSLEFRKKYHDLYELYARRFSVNKLLNEIDEKTADYLAKVQDSIASSQTKAYALPGALIGVAALVKSVSVLDFSLVIIGLLFIWYLTKVANDISREAYCTLSEQIDKSLNRYQELPGSNEGVKKAARDKKSALDGLIDKAKARLDKIDNLAVIMLVSGGLYLLFRIINEAAPDLFISVWFIFWHSLINSFFSC